jgi:hypothetical protein
VLLAAGCVPGWSVIPPPGVKAEGLDQLPEQDRAQRAGDGDVPSRLGLSDSGRRLVEHTLAGGLAERQRDAEALLNKVAATQRQLADVQRGLAATPAESSVRDVAERLKAASTELAAIE